MYVILKIHNARTNLLCNTNTQQFPSIILHNRSFLYSENISSITKSSKFCFIKNYLHSLFDVFISFFKIVSLFILFLFFPFSFLNLHYQKQPHPEVFLGKHVLKIYSKFTGEHPCRSVISIKLQCNLTETTLLHGCSSVNLLHIFRTSFPKNISGWLLLHYSPKEVVRQSS